VRTYQRIPAGSVGERTRTAARRRFKVRLAPADEAA
jgi:hypothetical protein